MKENKNDSILPESVIKQKRLKAIEKEDMRNFFIKLLVISLTVFLISKYIYGINIVEGQMMYPSIKDGDIAIYFRLDKNYYIGDIVSINKNDAKYISRIVAKAGDIVDMTEQGELIVNGNVQQEEIYFPTYTDTNGVTFPYKVNDNSVFVLGDFRTGTIDSRQFGEVYLDEIEGKIITVIRRRGI